jgi:HD-like signal output (HDOD) protein
VPTNSGLSKSAADSKETDETKTIRDELMEKVFQDSNLPALGLSVSRVVKMASSSDEAVRHLAHFVLSDAALTQKVLRVSNTVGYRTLSTSPVTTISKAIFLLGFDTIKTVALAMMLVDRMSGKRAKTVRAELAHAMCASIVGCEIAKMGQFKDAEEAAIASLFTNMGRLLVASHDPQRYLQMNALIQDGTAPLAAAQQVLGCSLESIAAEVLKEWQIPDTIIQALTPPQPGPLKPAKSRQEWMQQVAAFSSAAASVMPHIHVKGDETAVNDLLARYGDAFGLDKNKLTRLFAAVEQETAPLMAYANLLPGQLDREDMEGGAGNQKADGKSGSSVDFGVDPLPSEEPAGLPAELLLSGASNTDVLQITARHPSGKPMNARDLLLAGVRDVTEMMSSGRCKANDLIMLVLETLYNSLGFRFATVCLKDVKANQFRARISLGENNAARQAGFVFSAATGRDLFSLALENDADLLISDATESKIRALIPAWHKTLLPDATSFIVLPLIVQSKPLGMFYADRKEFALEGVPPDETALIKTLKGQVLNALNMTTR